PAPEKDRRPSRRPSRSSRRPAPGTRPPRPRRNRLRPNRPRPATRTGRFRRGRSRRGAPASPSAARGGGRARRGGPAASGPAPRGWKRSARGASVFWTDPASSAYVQVDGTPWSGDPYEHWLVWERQAAADGRLKDFERLSITRTRVGDEPAADIEFTWTRSDG